MEAETHLAGGLLAGATLLVAYANKDFGIGDIAILPSLGYVTASMAGSLFPDIDIHTSTIGRKAGFISVLIEWICGHRLLFHAFALYILIYYGVSLQFRSLETYMFAFLFGVSSHLVLDLFNKKGVPLLFPLSTKHFYIVGVSCRGLAERITQILIIAATVLSFYNLSIILDK